MAAMYFWIDWSEPGHPAIRPYEAGAKGLPLRFYNAKNDIRTVMGSHYWGRYIPRGLTHLTIRDVLRQEAMRKERETNSHLAS